MTVSSTTTKNSYNGDGSTVAFSYTFRILDEDDIAVILRNNATGNETTQNISANYSVSGVGDAGGGTITFVTAPPTGNTVVLLRATPLTQVTDYTPNDPFPAESHEDALDKLTFITQELSEEVGRSLKLSQTNEIATAEFTAGAAARANKVLGFDSAGDLTVLQEIGIYKGTDTTVTTAAYDPRDLVKSTTAAQLNNVYIALQASPLGTSLTNTTYWALVVDAVSAATSAANAAASEAAAAISESNAATSASTASTQATNAASSATSSASSATAAQTAQAAAEAALDTFDDRFLGAKASDPTLDNDGNALLDGAIYFNTTDDIMKVYDLTNTVWRNLALTGTDQTNVNLVAGQISPTNNIATVAGISADITTTATNNANITTVATDIANVNLVGADIANVNTVASNLADVNAFADTYFISATAPASPTLGDLWFDTTNDIMKVYSASGFVNAGSSVNGTANRYVYTATSGQTTFAATYDAGYIDVYLNGVKLQSGTDFTATDGANVVLTVGAALNDQIDIVGYGTFNIAIPDISGDATPTLGGDLATSGNDITFGDSDKAIFGAGSDLRIYHDGSASYIDDTGTGNLKIRAANFEVQDSTGTNTIISAVASDGEARLNYGGSMKLNTSSTGIDITGNATFDDNGKAIFGNASDLQIYHDGSNSIIRDTGTGSLMLDGTNVEIRSGGTQESMAKFLANGAATLYYNNAEKLATTATGVDVTGDLEADGINIGTSSSVGSLTISEDTTDLASFAVPAQSNSLRIRHTSGGQMRFGMTTSHALSLMTNAADRLTVDANGNVGIGTSSPTADLHISYGSGSGLLIEDTTNSPSVKSVITSGNTESYFGATSNHPVVFLQNNTERLRIDSSGNVLVGTTDTSPASNDVAGSLRSTTGLIQASVSGNPCLFVNRKTNDGNVVSIRRAGSQVGSISVTGSSTSYNTSSDHRLKENVDYTWDATTRLKQLKPARFNFIADADTTVDGFLAHEVQDIVPEAISGTKDAMRDEEYTVSAATGDIYTPAIEAVLDEDGNEVTPAVAEVIHSTDVERPEELAEGQQWRETTAAVMGTRSVPDYQGIDQSKLVPLLVKTIQELEARIAALENV